MYFHSSSCHITHDHIRNDTYDDDIFVYCHVFNNHRAFLSRCRRRMIKRMTFKSIMHSYICTCASCCIVMSFHIVNHHASMNTCTFVRACIRHVYAFVSATIGASFIFVSRFALRVFFGASFDCVLRFDARSIFDAYFTSNCARTILYSC